MLALQLTALSRVAYLCDHYNYVQRFPTVNSTAHRGLVLLQGAGTFVISEGCHRSPRGQLHSDLLHVTRLEGSAAGWSPGWAFVWPSWSASSRLWSASRISFLWSIREAEPSLLWGSPGSDTRLHSCVLVAKDALGCSEGMASMSPEHIFKH